MAPVHGYGPIPFMAMAPFHSWPWRIPFMAMVLSLSHPYNCHCRTPKPLAHALAHGLRITPARISPESIDSGHQNLLALKVVT